jgi:hypothetical protein
VPGDEDHRMPVGLRRDAGASAAQAERIVDEGHDQLDPGRARGEREDVGPVLAFGRPADMVGGPQEGRLVEKEIVGTRRWRPRRACRPRSPHRHSCGCAHARRQRSAGAARPRSRRSSTCPMTRVDRSTRQPPSRPTSVMSSARPSSMWRSGPRSRPAVRSTMSRHSWTRAPRPSSSRPSRPIRSAFPGFRTRRCSPLLPPSRPQEAWPGPRRERRHRPGRVGGTQDSRPLHRVGTRPAV